VGAQQVLKNKDGARCLSEFQKSFSLVLGSVFCGWALAKFIQLGLSLLAACCNIALPERRRLGTATSC
jgi:hypothetical protein